MFPESELLGVDIVVPDITYLIENKTARPGDHPHARARRPHRRPALDSLRAQRPGLRHGVHPGLRRRQARRARLLDDTELIEIVPGEKFTLGPFTIEPIRVTHSLVDCVALAIETPVGVDRPYRRLQDRSLAARRQGLRPASLSPNTASAACWRCCRTPPTWIAPATRPASGQ